MSSMLGRRKTAWLAAASLMAGISLGGCGHAPNEKAAESVAQETAEDHDASAQRSSGVIVRVAAAEKRNFSESVSGFGRCEALPEKLAILTPAVEGQVETILVKPGDAVHAGQPVVEFNKSVAAADYGEKTAAREGLAASLKLLTTPPRPDEEQISRLAIGQANAAVAKAQSLVDRLRPLKERAEVSDQQYFEAEQSLAAARAQQQTAEAQHRLLMQGPRKEAIAEAQARVDAADKSAALSRAQLELLILRAPIDGRLDTLDCHPGQTVAAGTVVGQIVDAREVFGVLWLPTAGARRVRVGQPGHVSVAADNSEPDEKSAARPAAGTGQVIFVGEVADPQTGNIPVRVKIDNAESVFKIGETLGIAIEVGMPEMRLAVPAAAINDVGEGPVLSVVRNGKTVVLHPKLETTVEGWVAVSQTDLKVGEPVVVEGAYNLPEGTEVETVGVEHEQPDE